MNQSQLYDYVKLKCKEFDKSASNNLCDLWQYHVKQVYSIALHLADTYKADKEVVGCAALLHDIAKIIDPKCEEVHNEVGAQMAVGLIGDDLPKQKVDHIQKCIRNHRKGAKEENLSTEETCVADADAVSVILNVPDYIAWSTSMGNSVADTIKHTIKKLKKSFDKTSKPTQEMFRKNYESAIKTLEGHFMFGKRE